jgi:NADP-dependent 3-hydroxy acid dehydrogenase YdfG
MALKKGSQWSNWSWDKPVKAFIWRSSRICRPIGGLPPGFFEDSLPHLLLRNNSIINLSSIGGHQVWPTCAVYSATKFAVLAISEGLRQENTDVRVTVITPGVVESELADTISDPATRQYMVDYRKIALTPDAIARAMAYAIEQPADVDVNEIIVRPTAGAQ